MLDHTERKIEEHKECRYRLELDGETHLCHDMEEIALELTSYESNGNPNLFVRLYPAEYAEAIEKPGLAGAVYELKPGRYTDPIAIGWIYDRPSEEAHKMSES